jgi:hypothetical protein
MCTRKVHSIAVLTVLLASFSAGIASANDASELSRRAERSSAIDSKQNKAGWELSKLARYFKPQHGPTKLYINFDGWVNCDGKDHIIIPFQSTTGHRDMDIQEILYRVSEAFAPFNVQVLRMYGNGRYAREGGNTTVFIGAQTANMDQGGRKYQHFYSRGRSHTVTEKEPDTSYPLAGSPYHLAYLDPIGQRPDSSAWVNMSNNMYLSRTLAHEAGHCWGLVHVHSADLPDSMNYDKPSNQLGFLDRSFPTAALNWNAKAGKMDQVPLPKYRGDSITSQNSFRFLMTVLGPRPVDDHPNVANHNNVDAAYSEGPGQELLPDAPISGEIAPRGDYDVFRTEPAAGGSLEVEVKLPADSKLKPVILVFDNGGDKLRAAALSNGKTRACKLRWPAPAGQAFKVVVGAIDGASTGAYQVVVRPAGPQPRELASHRPVR